jgi:hypothetical protein
MSPYLPLIFLSRFYPPTAASPVFQPCSSELSSHLEMVIIYSVPGTRPDTQLHARDRRNTESWCSVNLVTRIVRSSTPRKVTVMTTNSRSVAWRVSHRWSAGVTFSSRLNIHPLTPDFVTLLRTVTPRPVWEECLRDSSLATHCRKKNRDCSIPTTSGSNNPTGRKVFDLIQSLDDWAVD